MLPEFYELKKVIENNPWHNNESTFTHTLAVLNELQKFFKNNKNAKLKLYLNKKIDAYRRKELLFLAIVLHDLGKKETIITKGKISSFPNHEKISVRKARKILRNFNLTGKEKDIVLGIIKDHSHIHDIVRPENFTLAKQFNEIKKISKNYFIELIIMVMADTTAGFLKTTNPSEYKFRVDFYQNELREFEF